jgi:predicted porin
MKKSLIALAVMAAAGAASAQSSVTLFGIIDATVTWGKGSIADKVALSNNGYNSSRIGFRGTEDLGGGLSASFWIEAGFNADDGTGLASNTNNQLSGTGLPATPNGRQGIMFNRRSTVSLAGNWGELRLGRDYLPQFWNVSTFDPFGLNGVGQSVVHFFSATNASGTTDPAATRASNSIGYLLPANLGGFYGQVMYYMGENGEGPQEDDGSGWGVRGGFASGPFNVSAAYGKTNVGILPAFPGGADINVWNVGGQWDFGIARVMGNYVHHELDGSGTDFTGSGWTLGGLIPVGPGEIRLAYSTYKVDLGADPKVSKWAIGYVHNLSKRTAVYATYAHLSNDNGASLSLGGAVTGVNSSSSGVDVGLRHSF